MFGIDFNFLRKAKEDLEAKRAALDAELEDVCRQRDRVLSTPGSKEDLKAMLGDWVSANQEKYRQSLRETLLKFTRNPRNMTARELADIMGLSGAPQSYGDSVQTQDVDQALCGLFGPLLKSAIVEQIDSMEWHEGSMTASERQEKADRLSMRIEQVQSDIKKLDAAAEEAGIERPRFGHFN